MPDFGEGRTVLQDAYPDARFTPGLKLRAGKFKSRRRPRAPALGHRPALRRSRAADGAGAQPRRRRDALRRPRAVLTYAVGVFNGVPDGGSGDVDDSPGKDVVAASSRRSGPAAHSACSRSASASPAASASARARSPRRRSAELRTTASSCGSASAPTAPSTRPSPTAAARASRRRGSSTSARSASGEYVSRCRRCGAPAVADAVENRAWQVDGLVRAHRRDRQPAIAPRRAFDPQGRAGAPSRCARANALERRRGPSPRSPTPTAAAPGARGGTPA